MSAVTLLHSGTSSAEHIVDASFIEIPSLLIKWPIVVVFFFFQAEDGIRDADVTGVQTCALPISEIAPLRAGTAQAPGRPRQARVLQDRHRVGAPDPQLRARPVAHQGSAHWGRERDRKSVV